MTLVKKLGEYQHKFDSLGGWELKNKGETILISNRQELKDVWSYEIKGGERI